MSKKTYIKKQEPIADGRLDPKLGFMSDAEMRRRSGRESEMKELVAERPKKRAKKAVRK